MDYEELKELIPEPPKRQTIEVKSEIYCDRIIEAILSHHREAEFIKSFVRAAKHKYSVLERGERNDKFPNVAVLKQYQHELGIYTEILELLKKLKP